MAELIALVYSLLSKAVEPGAAFAGGAARLGLLMVVAAGILVALLALLKVKQPALRASFTLLTWAGLLGLGSQPEIWCLSDNPFSAAFWSSHDWSGVLLTGLLLFYLAARSEISRQSRWPLQHVESTIMVLVLFAVQAITESPDLLELPFSWQKPPIRRCDFRDLSYPEAAVSARAAHGLFEQPRLYSLAVEGEQNIAACS